MFDGGDYKLLAWEARDVIELTKYRDRSAAELWDHRLWVGLSHHPSLSRHHSLLSCFCFFFFFSFINKGQTKYCFDRKKLSVNGKNKPATEKN